MSRVEVEGRMFGIEEAARLVDDGKVVRETRSAFFTAPGFRMRVWAFLHGYGWPA